MRIRPVGTGDTDAVADVFLSALASMTYLPELYTDTETRAFIKDILLPNNEVWVADDAGEVIGFVGFGQNSIRHLWVRQDAQNRGIGTALLNVAKGRCPDGLRLSVFQQNVGARRLYERNGFVLTELRDGHHNEENEPDAIYVWEPQPES